jgi:hypothetical protein
MRDVQDWSLGLDALQGVVSMWCGWVCHAALGRYQWWSCDVSLAALGTAEVRFFYAVGV